MRPMGAHHRVVIAQMHTCTHGNWLLARGQMHFSRHRARTDVKRQPFLDSRRQFSLEIILRHRFFITAYLHHLLVHPKQLLLGWLHVLLLFVSSSSSPKQYATYVPIFSRLIPLFKLAAESR